MNLEMLAKTTAREPELLRLGAGGVVPVQWDTAEKADPGTLTGWAAVYNVVDQQDDILQHGALRKSLSDWRSSSRVIGLTLDHKNDAEGLIGALVDAEDTSYGLRATFRFSSTAKAQEARTKAREGILNGLSIWGPIFEKAFQDVAGKSVRVLKEVGLWFVGLTPVPANASALVLKAASQTSMTAGLPDEWVEDMRSALTIRVPTARKAAVDLLVKHQYAAVLDPPAADSEGSSTGGDEGEDDSGDVGSEDVATKYAHALSIIGESGPDILPPGGEPNDSLAGLLSSVDATDTKSALDGLEAELRSESRDHHPPEGSGR